MNILFRLSLVLFLTSLTQLSIASSAISVKKNVFLLGKNFDAKSAEGMLIRNLKGVKKTAYGFHQENNLEWTSKYGSVTFTQIGKEFPIGGMNDKGLVIEMLANENAHYPANSQSTLSEYEWIQYNLDNYATAAEVMYFIDSIAITQIHSSIHFIVADRGGRGFTIDFVDGKAVISKPEEEFQVLTNHNFKKTDDYYHENSNQINLESRSSFNRYNQLRALANTNKVLTKDRMFDVLEKSAQNEADLKTQWTIIYDPYNYQLFFKTAKNPVVKTISFKIINFSNNLSNVAMDINNNNVYWKPLTPERNMKLINKGINLKVDTELFNQHAFEPNNGGFDKVFANHYTDILVNLVTKKTIGTYQLNLIEGEENFNNSKAIERKVVSTSFQPTTAIFYTVPKKEYAIKVYYSSKESMTEKSLVKAKAVSNNKKSLFGKMKYSKAKFNPADKNSLTIKL